MPRIILPKSRVDHGQSYQDVLAAAEEARHLVDKHDLFIAGPLIIAQWEHRWMVCDYIMWATQFDGTDWVAREIVAL